MEVADEEHGLRRALGPLNLVALEIGAIIGAGIFVAVFAALVDISILGHLVSIGTLLAFVIVCAGVLVLRYRHPELRRPFRTPGVPFVPARGILVSLAMMISLPLDTWLRLLVWLAIGMVIYFGYSRKHSRVQQGQSGVPLVSPTGGH